MDLHAAVICKYYKKEHLSLNIIFYNTPCAPPVDIVEIIKPLFYAKKWFLRCIMKVTAVLMSAFINKGGISGSFTLNSSQHNIECEPVAYQQFFLGFPGFNSDLNHQ